MQSRHYTTCAMCQEKLTLLDIDRLFSEHIGYSFCDRNSTTPAEKCSEPDILS